MCIVKLTLKHPAKQHVSLSAVNVRIRPNRDVKLWVIIAIVNCLYKVAVITLVFCKSTVYGFYKRTCDMLFDCRDYESLSKENVFENNKLVSTNCACLQYAFDTIYINLLH